VQANKVKLLEKLKLHIQSTNTERFSTDAVDSIIRDFVLYANISFTMFALQWLTSSMSHLVPLVAAIFSLHIVLTLFSQ